MNAGELIAVLKQYNPNTPVFKHEHEGTYTDLDRVSERWMRIEDGTIEALPYDDMATAGDFKGIPL